MTAPKEVKVYPLNLILMKVRLSEMPQDFVSHFDYLTEVQALKADLEAKDERIKQLETRIKGMVLSLQKHGQNIDVKFHIDWLNEALSQKGG